ncbi:hypothetical protein M427DRAFT_52635 [Gonapodya prolifera JEL478]|uniref:UV-stimulated scaffold protein A C-terminal domain-containing protein n=1 Tax=Gonapodya prolifera (strain JEL478) TaxID=1344416 RepID=A0A139ASP2_GONPJ|nr:hypothetical protein M427DRAFT_52635 [Gonapodya prolifera JEL478]|eukprot:KXS19760.1 hypothetical protein M427DRAFT_52635 [Gonapodya prolifera JEL478]
MPSKDTLSILVARLVKSSELDETLLIELKRRCKQSETTVLEAYSNLKELMTSPTASTRLGVLAVVDVLCNRSHPFRARFFSDLGSWGQKCEGVDLTRNRDTDLLRERARTLLERLHKKFAPAYPELRSVQTFLDRLLPSLNPEPERRTPRINPPEQRTRRQQAHINVEVSPPFDPTTADVLTVNAIRHPEPDNGENTDNEVTNSQRAELLVTAPVVDYDEDLSHWQTSSMNFNQSGLKRAHRFLGEVTDDHELSEESIAALKRRRVRINVTESVSDIHECRFPLTNGLLCRRKDLRICPLHGLIKPRDEKGNLLI